MSKTESRRREIVEILAQFVLAQGIQGASLRPLAAAAGTSDRMLLHYFKDKEELLTAVLVQISDQLLAILDNAQPGKLTMAQMLPLLAGMMKDPLIRPYLRIWLELAALAASGDQAYRDIARTIGDAFYDWILDTLDVDDESQRPSTAALTFATMEGLVLLDAVGFDEYIAYALQKVQETES